MNLTGTQARGIDGAGLEQGLVQVVKSQDLLEDKTLDFKQVFKKINFLKQAEKSNELNKEPVVSEIRTCEENEVVKFYNWAKVRGLGLTKLRLDNTSGILSVRMIGDQTHDYHQIVADILKLDKAKDFADPKLMPEKFLGASKAPHSTYEFQEAVPNNKESLQKQKLKHKQKQKSDREKDIKSGLYQGYALNSSTSIYCDNFCFGLTPGAYPVTNGFSFQALDNTSSVSPYPMAKSNSIGAFPCSLFRFSAKASGEATSEGLGSSVMKPSQQQPSCPYHNEDEELLFVIRANLYRLSDGDWMMRAPGRVKIWRHIETKKLRVEMRQEQVLNVCLNHLLNTDVVYRPMDSKSWIFAANDFSEGKGVLERFTLRFKNQNAAQEFIRAVMSAVSGTAQAVKKKSTRVQRRTKKGMEKITN
ncbi:E3 SUMO-protein ligase RanBP2-like isoform X2 [Drosophila serrata]|nr:E3 SUMO-protein ligase RanBP2-like isoform X2 [Drosophila serrata]